jgi:hypothetical protein
MPTRDLEWVGWIERLIDTHPIDYHETNAPIRQSQVHNYPNGNSTAAVGGTAREYIVGGQPFYNRETHESDNTVRIGINGAIIGAVGSSLRTNPIPTQNFTSSSITTSQRQFPMNDDSFLRSTQNMIDSGNSAHDYRRLLSVFGDGTENMGASETEIDSLPTHTIKNLENDLPPKDLRQCSICLDDFSSGDERKILPCFHAYHKACIDQALRNRAICPLCNSSLH